MAIPLPSSCIETGAVSTVPPWEFPTVAVNTTRRTSDLPLAPGTRAKCARYATFVPTRRQGSAANTCYVVSSFYRVNVTDFVSWNPSLKYNDSKPESCVLRQGYQYCAQLAVATPASGVSVSSSTTTKPAPTQNGMVENCNKFYKVKSGDGCYDIAAGNDISLDAFYSFNPTVGNDCSKLFLDYYVCVGV